jgi:hypothetical protein
MAFCIFLERRCVLGKVDVQCLHSVVPELFLGNVFIMLEA